MKTTIAQLIKGEALIHDLATDPSLRGLIAGLEDGLLGIGSGDVKLDDFPRVLDAASDTLENVLAGRPASFSWRVLAQGKPAAPNELRGIIEVRPILDYGALEAGRAASDAIRAAAAEIAPKYQATVRLTGPVAMADEEFATIKEGAVRNGLITIAIVLVILWLALRSGRLILAVFVNLFVGLALTAALGMMMVGTLNLISVYFAVLFVGIGVDFGIQFSVRYRSERHEVGELGPALLRTGKFVGAPLTLAAAATAAGFFSFLPTDYRGVSELGQIAGFGMLIAFVTSVTFLPALIRLLNPPGEPEPLGFSFLAPVDEFLERRRIPIIIGTALVVVAGLPLLYWLQFDFNPINLRSPKVGIDCDLSRSQPRSLQQYQRRRSPGAVARRRHGDRGAPCEGAGSIARADARDLRAAGPRGEAAGHRGCRQDVRRTPSIPPTSCRRRATRRTSMRSRKAPTGSSRPPARKPVRAPWPPSASPPT